MIYSMPPEPPPPPPPPAVAIHTSPSGHVGRAMVFVVVGVAIYSFYVTEYL
jgi:hypothetical protein